MNWLRKAQEEIKKYDSPATTDHELSKPDDYITNEEGEDTELSNYGIVVRIPYIVPSSTIAKIKRVVAGLVNSWPGAIAHYYPRGRDPESRLFINLPEKFFYGQQSKDDTNKALEHYEEVKQALQSFSSGDKYLPIRIDFDIYISLDDSDIAQDKKYQLV
jgi:hypothetical protein